MSSYYSICDLIQLDMCKGGVSVPVTEARGLVSSVARGLVSSVARGICVYKKGGVSLPAT